MSGFLPSIAGALDLSVKCEWQRRGAKLVTVASHFAWRNPLRYLSPTTRHPCYSKVYCGLIFAKQQSLSNNRISTETDNTRLLHLAVNQTIKPSNQSAVDANSCLNRIKFVNLFNKLGLVDSSVIATLLRIPRHCYSTFSSRMTSWVSLLCSENTDQSKSRQNDDDY